MRFKFRRLSILCVAVLSWVSPVANFVSPLDAQQRSENAPAPRPHPDLEAIVGRWTIADLPPGATYTTSCERFPGGYQVVCRSESRNNEGQLVQGMNIIAFSPSGGDYQYLGMSSSGRLELLRGTFTAGKLVLTGTTGTGATAVQTRVTIAPTKERIEITQEYREEHGPWTESAKVRYVPAS